jgi:hypothetical protein
MGNRKQKRELGIPKKVTYEIGFYADVLYTNFNFLRAINHLSIKFLFIIIYL